MTSLTTTQRRIPDFFIVGHPKCGTTALYEMLRSHPQIYMPDAKEPNFFSGEWQAPDGPPQTFDDYLSLFDAARPEQRIGEASVSYLASREAASGIADVQPAAQIIAILREPASFLHSLHLQLVRVNLETQENLREALSLEDDRRQGRHVPRSAPNWHRRLFYSDQVRYVDQLQRYHALFPPEQVMVLIYDDFQCDNEATLRRVLRFLDVDDTFSIEVTKTNPTVRVRFRHLNQVIYSVHARQHPVWRTARERVKPLIPGQVRRRLLETVVYGAPRPPDEGLMMELRRRFKPEVVALGDYLDRDLVSLWGYDGID
jgi:hypothetical protein